VVLLLAGKRHVAVALVSYGFRTNNWRFGDVGRDLTELEQKLASRSRKT
jgi:hypothetical protein